MSETEVFKGEIEQGYLLLKMKGDPQTYGVCILPGHKQAAAMFLANLAASFCEGGKLMVTPVDFVKFNAIEQKIDKPIKWICAENHATAKKWADSQGLVAVTEWLYVSCDNDLPSDSERKQLIAVVHGRGGKLEEGSRLFNLVEEARERGFKIVKVRA